MTKHRSLADWFSVVALVIAVLTLAACNPFDDDSDDASGDSSSGDLTAEQLIQLASDRWNETDSAHFALDIEGSTYLDSEESIELSSAEGDLLRPQSVEATAQIGVGMVNLDVSLIFIGDEAYMTDFLTGNWGPAPDDFSYNPSLLLSADEGLGRVLEQMRDPEIEGTQQIDGREAIHLTGFVTEDMIDSLTAGAISGDEIGVDIWFDSETYDVLRLRLSEPEADSDEPVIWNIDFSAHNEPVEIEAPSV